MDVRVEDLARRAVASVLIGGHDATSHLAPYLTSFEYTDNAEGKSDEVSIELHDRDGVWREQWLPRKGTGIVASIRCLNWWGPGQNTSLSCGSFTCDETSVSGFPDKVSFKGVSASLSGPLRETARTQAWEEYTLQGVANDIASRNGLSLYYDAPSHNFGRQDQRSESDLAFLQRLSEDRGVNVKVRDDKIILYSAKDADARAGSLTFLRAGAGYSVVSDYDFKEKSEGTAFRACEVQYTDPATQELRTYIYNPGGVALTEENTCKALTLDKRVESEADAIAFAKNSLRASNKGETTGSFTVMGHPGLIAGVTIEMSGFGRLSGRYFVTKVAHSLGDKYTSKAEIRSVIGY